MITCNLFEAGISEGAKQKFGLAFWERDRTGQAVRLVWSANKISLGRMPGEGFHNSAVSLRPGPTFCRQPPPSDRITEIIAAAQTSGFALVAAQIKTW